MRFAMRFAGAFLCLVSMAFGQDQDKPDVALFQDTQLGMTFQYPKSWKIEQRKHDWRLAIPMANEAEATLEIFRAGWVGSIEEWELTQRNMNATLRSETLRQWQEMILGVPFLLTKSRPISQEDAKLVLQGLIYSKGQNKMLFRLTAPEALFDDAEFVVRKALESIRTLDGKLPQAEDPAAVPLPPERGAKNKPPAPPKVIELGATGGREVEKAPEKHAAKVAGRDVAFHFPSGWKLEALESGELRLTSENAPGFVSVRLASTLDSISPPRALLRASIESLKEFVDSSLREETVPKANKAGQRAARVWRTGKGASGPIASFDGVVFHDIFYAVITWKGTAADYAPILQTLMEFLNTVSVEPAD